jgi:transposase InsO family protein
MRLRKAIVEFDLDAAPRGAVTRFCQANAISRSAFYKVRAQAAGSGDPGRVPPPGSKAPKSSPLKTPSAMERLAIDKRLELIAGGWDGGPVSVRSRLIRAGHRDVPSRATLARIFTRHGLVRPEPAKRPRSSYKGFVYPRANDLWQLDGTEWRLDDDARTKQVIYQVEDDHSRLILSWAISETENGATAVSVVSDAIKRHGVPTRFLTDNGSAFNQSRRPNGASAPLERYLKTFGTKPIAGSIAHPQTQGKNERLHSTLQQFLEAHRPITTTERLAELLEEFAHEYNENRPHQRLPDNQTPGEAYRSAVKAPAPPLPPPPMPDLFHAAGATDQRPATPKRHRVHNSYQIGGLTWADREVGPDGRASISNCTIYVTRRWAGQTLHILVTDDTLEVFSPDGESLGVLARPAPGRKRTHLNLHVDGIDCG